MRLLSGLCGLLMLVALSSCSSSAQFPGSVANSPPPTTAQATGVAAQVATYRTRGTSAADHILDGCQQAALAPQKPGVNKSDLPPCRTMAISLEIRTATAAVTSLATQVAAFRSTSVPTATRLATVAKLKALTGALRTWGRCVDALTTPRYFQGSHCAAEVKRSDAARLALLNTAAHWPKP